MGFCNILNSYRSPRLWKVRTQQALFFFLDSCKRYHLVEIDFQRSNLHKETAEFFRIHSKHDI